jgi:hypothetical protein
LPLSNISVAPFRQRLEKGRAAGSVVREALMGAPLSLGSHAHVTAIADGGAPGARRIVIVSAPRTTDID